MGRIYHRRMRESGDSHWNDGHAKERRENNRAGCPPTLSKTKNMSAGVKRGSRHGRCGIR